MDEEVNISELAHLLYNNLLASCPIDTGKMKDNITIDELDDRFIITISKGVPYARFVNYNWGSRSQRKRQIYEKKKLSKERDNYKWVEMTIEQTIASIKAGGVVNEL